MQADFDTPIDNGNSNSNSSSTKLKHPRAAIAHVLFKLIPVSFYLFSAFFRNNDTTSFVLVFVAMVCFGAVDHWTTSRVGGRQLAGLRFSQKWRQDGTSEWIFESLPKERISSADSRFFWVILLSTTGIWTFFSVIALLRFKFLWLVSTLIMLGLTGSLTWGYAQCQRDARKKLRDLGMRAAVSGMKNMVTGN